MTQITVLVDGREAFSKKVDNCELSIGRGALRLSAEFPTMQPDSFPDLPTGTLLDGELNWTAK